MQKFRGRLLARLWQRGIVRFQPFAARLEEAAENVLSVRSASLRACLRQSGFCLLSA
jgi:hypothetical protein